MSKDKNQKYFGVSLSEITKREGSLIPNIICKLINYLLRNGLEEEGIFRINGSAKTVEKLMSQFDKKGDADLSNVSEPAVIASLLKQYLRDLPDTLIPANMTQSFVATQEAHLKDSKNLLSNLRRLVSALPSENFRTLKYLVAFLVLASKRHSSSKMNVNALSTVFGPNIFKCGPGFAGLKEQGVTNCIVLQFITKYQQIFTSLEEELTPYDERFTLDGLMELLKKDKHSIKAKHDTPLKTLTAVNNAAMKVQHAGTNPSHLLNANKKFSTIDREGDGIKESLNKNLNSKENVNEIVDNKYARLMTGDENYIAAIPLLANSKRRGSLESETVVMSEIVLSEIDKVIMKYVFNESPSGESLSGDDDDDDDKVRVGNNLINSSKAQSQTIPSTNLKNINNNSSPTKQKVKHSKHVLPNSEDEEDEDDDDSVADFSEDDDDDDDDDDSDLQEESGTNRTVIKCPSFVNRASNRGSTKELLVKKDDGPLITEAAHFSKAGNGDDGDVSFHSDSDSSQKMKHLKKKTQIILQRLKALEEEFENNFGRKITSSDLPNNPRIKYLRKELEKCRNHLDDPGTDDVGDHHHHHQHHQQQRQQNTTSVKETFDSLMENLHIKRISSGRPEDPKLMSSQQLTDEKTSLQKALLKFEQIHGRPNTSTTKGIMMPLYDRYRVVKRILNQNKKSESSGNHHHHRPSSSGSGVSRNEIKEELNFNQMTLSQLAAELEKTRQQKKNLQLELQRFEQKFQMENGRRVQKADQMVKANEYRQYVNIKSRLKLLEVLTAKCQKQSTNHGSS